MRRLGKQLQKSTSWIFHLFRLKTPELIRLTYLAYIYRKPSPPKLRIQLHELIDGFIGDHSVGNIAVNFRIIKLGGGSVRSHGRGMLESAISSSP